MCGHKLSGAIKSMASIAATGEVVRSRLALQPLNYTMCSARTFSLLMPVRSRGIVRHCVDVHGDGGTVALAEGREQRVAHIAAQSDHNLNHGRGRG